MSDNEKCLYKELVEDLKEIMGVNNKLPMVSYSRLKQMHIKYGMENLHNVISNNKNYLATRISINTFQNETHMWWYIDKVLVSNLDCHDLEEYIL